MTDYLINLSKIPMCFLENVCYAVMFVVLVVYIVKYANVRSLFETYNLNINIDYR